MNFKWKYDIEMLALGRGFTVRLHLVSCSHFPSWVPGGVFCFCFLGIIPDGAQGLFSGSVHRDHSYWCSEDSSVLSGIEPGSAINKAILTSMLTF